jgi:hypothetical protein
VQRKLLRSRRLLVDTTVMEADVRYPTDSGLCANAVSRITRAVRAVHSAGLALRQRRVAPHPAFLWDSLREGLDGDERNVSTVGYVYSSDIAF